MEDSFMVRRSNTIILFIARVWVIVSFQAGTATVSGLPMQFWYDGKPSEHLIALYKQLLDFNI